MRYDVIVGNIGYVHTTNDLKDSKKAYKEYVRQSKSKYGRASNEPVTLMDNARSDILEEYIPLDKFFKYTTKEALLIEALRSCHAALKNLHKIQMWDKLDDDCYDEAIDAENSAKATLEEVKENESEN